MNSENDHHDHHKMMIEDFKKRFYISLIVTIPILILSPMIQEWVNISVDFTGSKYILFALATFIYFYGGWPFLTGFIDEIKIKKPGMMTLIAMAISVAYLYSSATVFGLEGNDFFWELATLVDIMLLGHWIEMKSVLSASKALDKLAELMPDEAHLFKDGDVVDVDVKELNSGDKILIKPGEKIPADGTIVKGSSYINESMLTGESKPVEKNKGDELIGGSVNGEGSLEVKVENLGEDSYLSKVINMVKQAQESKSKTQNLADRAAFWLTIIALTLGFATLIVWLFLGRSFTFAIARMATVMVITCPHALGLATPLVVATSTALSAKNGLLIRNRTAFENSRKIDTIVFDKTGTLTLGEFGVNFIEIFNENYDEQRVIQLASALENNSEHPIATGIIRKAKEMDIEPLDMNDFQAMKGKGVKGKIENKDVMVVSPGYLKNNDISLPSDLPDHDISTNVFLLVNDELIAAIGLADKIREESYEAIESLKEQGIKCWMLTGDNEKTAAQVSKELNLDGYFAEVLPDEKQDKIKELQEDKKYVAMTGDGVNDAPALAQADVGIAIGSGTDVAAETADIILVNSNPQDVVSLIKFGKATYKKMIQNLIWATGYNVIAIPLAAGVLYSVGIVISPAVGAILMSLSTVIVAINAKLLKVN
ncbi:copper-translocating P-type ATPase [Clostridium sp. D2Q-11]|uniref:P-type Cu(+) transporter n=1 Tax=Anaeromonas frigoriresistens TaxID=2683708 RepID=A0A942UUI0_9FIRM|nr:copper-translocating P-type ATPase [Anaeromonas frigoriresistens]MBS4538245.1 copper-translocating P-type ATPase [Anaeromonas frigoriresistens]